MAADGLMMPLLGLSFLQDYEGEWFLEVRVGPCKGEKCLWGKEHASSFVLHLISAVVLPEPGFLRL